MTWFIHNAGTILVSLVLLAAILLVIVVLIRDKKRGRTSCGCGCDHCAMAGACHTGPQTTLKD